MDVMGQQLVSPLDVVANGTRRLHAVWEGVQYTENDSTLLMIASLDAPLVAPGDPDHLLIFDNTFGDPFGGMWFNLCTLAPTPHTYAAPFSSFARSHF